LESESVRCRSSAQEGEGDDSLTGVAHLREELFFELVRERHLAGGDLVGAGSDEAELATGETFAAGDTDRRSEDAAGHGAECINIAEAGLGIEGGTGCVVGEVFEASLVFLGGAEDSGVEAAGEVGGVLGEPCTSPVADRFSSVGAGGLERLHSGLEAGCVESVDGEGPVTTLGAAGAAGEHRSGAEGRVGQGDVNDLDEFAVADRNGHVDRLSEQRIYDLNPFLFGSCHAGWVRYIRCCLVEVTD
jgi:hypothetical protein